MQPGWKGDVGEDAWGLGIPGNGVKVINCQVAIVGYAMYEAFRDYSHKLSG